VGCNPKSKKEDIKPIVTVSIVPQQFFVEQIAGDFLHVNVMVPPGGSPATYEPTPLQMKNLTQSKLYFRIGHVGFEKAWIDKLKSVSPNTKFVDTSKGLLLIEEQEWGEEHNHHHENDHCHEGFNPHIWLSPKMVKIQAKTMFDALVELYPHKQQEMKMNLDVFLNKCDSLNVKLAEQLNEAAGTSFIVYHPVWNYLARDFGLFQVALEHNGKEATADKLKEVIDFAHENNIRIIFAQKEFSDAQARTIANEIDGKVVLLNPLDYNWFSIMNEFGAVFQTINK